MTDNNVRLVVGGREFGGWKAVNIQAGIERLARSFELAVTGKWPGQVDVARRVQQGDLCELFIGADQVLAGFVDATPVDYDANSWNVGVRGRSRTADLVDCSAINSPGQWRGLRLEDIAAALAKPFGVTVRAEIDTGAVIADHQIDQGETVFESIDRMMRLRQVLASDDATGALVILTPGSAGRATTALELGVNVLKCSAAQDYADVYSEYVCKGQRAGDDGDFGESTTELQATALQSGLSRRRVLVIKQSGQADLGTCQDRVDYERGHRLGKAQEATYTVQGWRQADGSLWVPNQVVRVRDAMAGIDADRLVIEVAYQLSDAGQICVMKVGPIDGYLTKAAKVAKAKKAGGSAANWVDVK